MQIFFARNALLPSGMADNVRIVIDDQGVVADVARGEAPTGDILAGPVVPGMPNLHSHAFQRAMAGLAERAGPQGDSFWTWREIMYGFAARLDPEDLQAIASQLYVEMLKAGYTAVAEFHYIHKDASGIPYANRCELSDRIVAAAATAGIGLTLLPVLYGYSGFGAKPPTEGQKRFILNVDDWLTLNRELRSRHGSKPNLVIGAAPHSLRAVTPDTLRVAAAGLDAGQPIHIHIAEQVKEVEDCLAWSGRRPVEWLLANQDVNRRWCLVHATHMTEAETRALAASGAVAGICPTTEANLGDGFFPVVDYFAAGGAWGIGSDSNISISPSEELRWLEYGQRLRLQKRNVSTAVQGASVGVALWHQALAGGSRALAQPIGGIAVGRRADFVVLDPNSSTLAGRAGESVVDSLVFSGNIAPIRDVYVAGRRVVTQGHHDHEERIAQGFRAAMARLVAGL